MTTAQYDDDIQWEDPPESTSRKRPASRWMYIAERLRAHPGKWAMIGTQPNRAYAINQASHVRRGVYRDLPAGQFEAEARAVDGEYRVYVRYPGDKP